MSYIKHYQKYENVIDCFIITSASICIKFEYKSLIDLKLFDISFVALQIKSIYYSYRQQTDKVVINIRTKVYLDLLICFKVIDLKLQQNTLHKSL